MSDKYSKNDGNAPGQFYVDATCIDCDMCREIAPSTFRRNDEIGLSIAYHQPATDEELTMATDAMNSCPTNSIGNDG